MQIARANVQAVIGMLMQKHDTDQIADESDDGDDEHPISLDGLRSIKAGDCLVDQIRRDQKQKERVQKGGQNLSPLVSVRTSGSGRPQGNT